LALEPYMMKLACLQHFWHQFYKSVDSLNWILCLLKIRAFLHNVYLFLLSYVSIFLFQLPLQVSIAPFSSPSPTLLLSLFLFLSEILLVFSSALLPLLFFFFQEL
jgi:hypothetical protein